MFARTSVNILALALVGARGIRPLWPFSQGAPKPSEVNCTRDVVPVDPAPIRSPREIHTLLLSRFAGKDVAEIGTRNGDGMNCFARVTKSAVAIEMDQEYCRKLEVRAADLTAKGHRSYTVACRKYQDGTPDADIYTWWQQSPFLKNEELLDTLVSLQRQGKVRQGAEAVLLFDHKWEPDMKSLRRLETFMTWRANAIYNERDFCYAAVPKESVNYNFCKTRGAGTFTVAAIPLSKYHPHGRSSVGNAHHTTRAKSSKVPSHPPHRGPGSVAHAKQIREKLLETVQQEPVV